VARTVEVLSARDGDDGRDKVLLAFAVLAAGGAASCTERAQRTPLEFVDGTAASGLASFRQYTGDPRKGLILDTVGGGVALFDCDGDGDLDAYLTNGRRPDGSGAPDALYVNRGGGRFVDGTAAAGLGHTGWTCGVRASDYDGDGAVDLYLTCYGDNVLYRGRGDGTFEDVTARAGVGDPRWSTGACFLDHDKDGDLDLYVANYVDFDEADVRARGLHEEYKGIQVAFGPRGLPGAVDRFYENLGDGTFRDASEEVGITGVAFFGFQTVAFDYDLDGWIDVYVANDSQQNLLWRNDGQGHFEDRAFEAGLALSMDGNPQAGMGVAVGDFDGDLLADVYVTNFAEDYYTLYRGEPGGLFSDVTSRAGVRSATLSTLGWGCGFQDFDNDGDFDLYAVNSHVYPQVDELDLGTQYRQRNTLFENEGAGRFRHSARTGGAGFALEQTSRGSAAGDFDNDGDMDILIGNVDAAPTLLVNVGKPRGNWIKVRAIGDGANRDAVGARVVVRHAGGRALQLVGSAGSFLSSDDPRLHFGLGSAARVDELEVTWPGGAREVFRDVAAGQLVTIRQGAGIVAQGPLQ